MNNILQPGQVSQSIPMSTLEPATTTIENNGTTLENQKSSSSMATTSAHVESQLRRNPTSSSMSSNLPNNKTTDKDSMAPAGRQQHLTSFSFEDPNAGPSGNNSKLKNHLMSSVATSKLTAHNNTSDC